MPCISWSDSCSDSLVLNEYSKPSNIWLLSRRRRQSPNSASAFNHPIRPNSFVPSIHTSSRTDVHYPARDSKYLQGVVTAIMGLPFRAVPSSHTLRIVSLVISISAWSSRPINTQDAAGDTTNKTWSKYVCLYREPNPPTHELHDLTIYAVWVASGLVPEIITHPTLRLLSYILPWKRVYKQTSLLLTRCPVSVNYQELHGKPPYYRT